MKPLGLLDIIPLGFNIFSFKIIEWNGVYGDDVSWIGDKSDDVNRTKTEGGDRVEVDAWMKPDGGGRQIIVVRQQAKTKWKTKVEDKDKNVIALGLKWQIQKPISKMA